MLKDLLELKHRQTGESYQLVFMVGIDTRGRYWAIAASPQETIDIHEPNFFTKGPFTTKEEAAAQLIPMWQTAEKHPPPGYSIRRAPQPPTVPQWAIDTPLNIVVTELGEAGPEPDVVLDPLRGVRIVKGGDA